MGGSGRDCAAYATVLTPVVHLEVVWVTCVTCVCVCVCDVCVQVHAIQEQYYASVKRAQRVARNDSQLKSLFSQVLRAIAPNPQVLVAACAVVAYGSGLQFPTLVLSLKVALALVCRM